MHPAELPPDILLRDCDLTRTRRSGPGGQNRNKVETAIVIVHRPTGARAEGSERRSQQQNLSAAVFRLRVQVALQVRQQRDIAAAPSPLWISRTRGGRISINPAHDDFPAVLAEAMDVIVAHDWDLCGAAEQLGVTASQVIKFLKLEPRALQQVNDARQGRSLRPLR